MRDDLLSDEGEEGPSVISSGIEMELDFSHSEHDISIDFRKQCIPGGLNHFLNDKY